MLWGKLGYNPNLPDSYFRQVFATRFGPQFGPKFLEVETAASKILPLVESFHWNYMNFDWAGEACVNLSPSNNTARDGKGKDRSYRDLGDLKTNFNNIRAWIFNWTIDDEDFIGIPEYVGNLMTGVKKWPGEEKRMSPEEVADALDGYAAQIEQGLKELTPQPDMPGYKEAVSWEWDLQLLAYLSRYYAEKTRGGTDLLYYWCTGDAAAQQRAIASMTKCKDYWLKIVDLGGKVYTFPDINLYRDLVWSKYLKDVDMDIVFAQGAPAFKLRKSSRVVSFPQDVAKFENEIESGLDPMQSSSLSVEITEVDSSAADKFGFWINTMTNRKVAFVDLRKADGGRDTGVGYFTYPLTQSDKPWCVLNNDFGSVSKVWYGGKLIFDPKKQGSGKLKKGLAFQRDPKNGSLIIRCDGIKGRLWGCSPRHEYRDKE
jgi:hypothetical protein